MVCQHHMGESAGKPAHAHFFLVQLSDADLLWRFLHEQDNAAFECLVRRHGPMVMGLCRRILRHDQDAEDAFQATFLVLARKAGSISRRESLAGWLYKVAYRISLRCRSRNGRRAAKEFYAPAEVETAAEAPLSLDTQRVVDEEVHRLPDKYRAPILLCYLQGHTNEQAAERLNCPTGTVKIRLMRAREMLRKRLLRRGIGVSAALAMANMVGETLAAQTDQMVSVTVSAASAMRTGAPLVNVNLGAQVIHLVEGSLKKLVLAKMKIACAIMITVAVLIGADQLLQQAHSSPLPVATPMQPKFEPVIEPPLSPGMNSPIIPRRNHDFIVDGQRMLSQRTWNV